MDLDFKISTNLIVATHITGIFDVNRTATLANDDFSLVSDWAISISKLGLQAIIFHNNFTEKTCRLYESANLQFVKINYDTRFNPNIYRYVLYERFLQYCTSSIKNIFFTDISDVIVLKNPFVEKYFIENPYCIFCGDETKILENDWMKLHSEHLRMQIADYADYELKFKNHTLLNCGIIGGSITVVHPFINSLSSIHQQYNSSNQTAYTGDMGAFNYLIRTQYNNFVKHGNPINTVFKNYSTDESCWFKHK